MEISNMIGVALLVFEGGLPYICGFYWNLLIARLQIDLVEICGCPLAGQEGHQSAGLDTCS